MTMTDDNSTRSKQNEVVVPPPPRARNRGLVTPPPAAAEAPDNLAKPNAGLQDMNFKMELDFHRAFKATAGLRNMAMKELLEASFRCWVEHFGNDFEKQLLPPKSQGS